MRLDLKDHKIIEVLRKDSRISIRDIAKKTQLRPSTVHDRIKKLVRDKVIEKFTLKLNNKAVGENFIVFMLIKSEKEIPNDYLNSNKHIKEVFGVTGEYDVFLKLKFKDIEEFNDFVLGFRKRFQLINTLTLVATTNIKEEI
ncbi:MAG: Lrp/AsnC family transcriptional regulator [Candidatus Woesearchaeota archaeon]